jgi:hypothetical protein
MVVTIVLAPGLPGMTRLPSPTIDVASLRG